MGECYVVVSKGGEVGEFGVAVVGDEISEEGDGFVPVEELVLHGGGEVGGVCVVGVVWCGWVGGLVLGEEGGGGREVS